ncbi:MAG: TIGR02452 family protein [Lachnospiraceae bacterium]|nr:TIGR02452 family protein [Lachnospiraceae bacterium]
MNIRERNVEIFNDTLNVIKNSEKLSKSVETIIKNQKLILDNVKISIDSVDREKDAKIILSKKRTLEAASAYIEKKICVHNFASATNPGGGVTKGANAQEECICRCTDLYLCLDTNEYLQKFYGEHRKAHNPIYNDDIIYSPFVDVFKTDTVEPVLMDEKDWFKVDVLTCAAPNLRPVPSNEMNPDSCDKPTKLTDDEYIKILEKRVRKIFDVAAFYNNDVLILGAFGCGAFMNKPNLVAEVFNKVMKDYIRKFDVIEYAVYCRDFETKNYDEFKKVFKKFS